MRNKKSVLMTGIVNCECSDGDVHGIAPNVWCYEQVCVAPAANLLIARVSSSTVINHKCSFGELNLFLFFFVQGQK
jgi:hypothetical protein